MLKTFFYFVIGSIGCIISATSCILIPIPMLVLGLLRWIIPLNQLKKALGQGIEGLALFWDDINHIVLRYCTPTQWEFIQNTPPTPNKNYLVIANHQSWADILVLEEALYKHTGFSRYFIKKNLLHIPFAGWACRLLSYPSMYRYTKEHLAKHPEDKGKDIMLTRKACQKLKDIPFKLNNFAEGTRFTNKKHKNQASPFQYLLRPKAGGIAYALQVLYPQVHYIIDLTIIYHCRKPNVFKLLLGLIPKVTVYIDVFEITPGIVGDYQDDREYRIKFQSFINDLWLKKDQRLAAAKKDDMM